MQAAKALLEEQLRHEQKARLAAEASKEALVQQLAEQGSALVAANQQVCAQLQSQMVPPTPHNQCAVMWSPQLLS